MPNTFDQFGQPIVMVPYPPQQQQQQQEQEQLPTDGSETSDLVGSEVEEGLVVIHGDANELSVEAVNEVLPERDQEEVRKKLH